MKKPSPEAKKPLYIVLISVHGLIRGEELELGRDADTGGQTKYVVELARALGERADVEKVVLLTRRIIDDQVVLTAEGARQPEGDGRGPGRHRSFPAYHRESAAQSS